MSAAIELLERWLEARLPDDRWAWFDGRRRALAETRSTRDRDLLLGLIPRKLGRAELAPGAAELAAANTARAGWDPSDWSVETAARTLVLGDLAARDPTGFGETFRDLGRGADLHESMTLLRAVPLLPWDEAIDAAVAEGLRTSVRPVFEAIAHRSPCPRERFDENRWNHMVLKALFIDSTLAPIQGLDERANPELARILCDFARERRAAGRPVPPELWRCVGPFATGALLDDLARAAGEGAPAERDAARAALAASPDPRAGAVLARRPGKG